MQKRFILFFIISFIATSNHLKAQNIDIYDTTKIIALVGVIQSNTPTSNKNIVTQMYLKKVYHYIKTKSASLYLNYNSSIMDYMGFKNDYYFFKVPNDNKYLYMNNIPLKESDSLIIWNEKPVSGSLKFNLIKPI